LNAAPLRKEGSGRSPAGGDIEDQHHRAEREPQARRERRPGIENHHRGKRERKRAARRADAPRPQRDGDDRHHVEGALRRHREAREQRVAERADNRRRRRRFPGGKIKGQCRHASPSSRHQPREQAGNQRHVQARDAHQVSDPGAVEEPPFLAGDGALVADGESSQDARCGRSAEHALEAVAHRLAGLLDPIHETVALAEP